MRVRNGLTLIELLASLALLSLVLLATSAWIITAGRAGRSIADLERGAVPLDRALGVLQRDVDEAPDGAGPARGRQREGDTPPVFFDAEQNRVRILASRGLSGAGGVDGCSGWRLVEWRMEEGPDGQTALVREESPWEPGHASTSKPSRARTVLRGAVSFDVREVREPLATRVPWRVGGEARASRLTGYRVEVALASSPNDPAPRTSARTLFWSILR